MREVAQRSIVKLCIVCRGGVDHEEHLEPAREGGACRCFAAQMRHHSRDYKLRYIARAQPLFEVGMPKCVVLCLINDGNLWMLQFCDYRGVGVVFTQKVVVAPPRRHLPSIALVVAVARLYDVVVAVFVAVAVVWPQAVVGVSRMSRVLRVLRVLQEMFLQLLDFWCDRGGAGNEGV